MREDVVHVPAEGAACAAGQHHAGGQPAARPAAEPALSQTGAEMVSGVGEETTQSYVHYCCKKNCSRMARKSINFPLLTPNDQPRQVLCPKLGTLILHWCYEANVANK